MVAPSFQTMPIVREPYSKSNKMYVDVKNEKTGTIRTVRWYTEKEYMKAYGNKEKFKEAESIEVQKKIRGFAQDFIYLIAKRNSPFTAEDKEYIFKICGGTYAVDTGFYHSSAFALKETPNPQIFRVLKLSWDSFSKYYGKGNAQEGKSDLSKFIKETHPKLYFCFGANTYWNLTEKE